MIVDAVPCFVIQCRSTGEFLTEELFYSRLFADAGRLFDREEALLTGSDNLGEDFEICSFWVINRA